MCAFLCLLLQVDAERFDQERVLELVPPDGHFALMNYR